MKTEKEILEERCKSTVGYSEAKNKESFTVGAQVAISKCSEHFNEKIYKLEKQVSFFKSNYEATSSDLTTLSNIINKYSNT